MLLGLIAGLALSPKLWVSSRYYPLTSVGPLLHAFLFPFDYIAYFALLAHLLALCAAPKRPILIAAFTLIALLAMQDQSRWQPWFYQYIFMLLAVALAGPKREPDARNTCRLIVAAAYFWSGLAKLNPNFIDNFLPGLVIPIVGAKPGPAQWVIHDLAYVAPLFECALGIGLLTRRFRAAAVVSAIAMHVFILTALGPFGRNFNNVICPLNLAMIAFLLQLFLRDSEGQEPRDILWGRGFAFQRIALVLFAILPALSFFNLWDRYLSSALYSSNRRNAGVIYFDDTVFDRLPEPMDDYVTDEGPNRNGLEINAWSLDELNVPSYPEIRIYKNVARSICRYGDVELVIKRKLALVNSGKQTSYRCADLGG